MRDRFIKALDEAPTGILAALRYLEAVLKLLDPQLHVRIDQLCIFV
jgi:hypothetical protein